SERARASVAAVSKDRAAGTSVETLPLIAVRISTPMLTTSRSQASAMISGIEMLQSIAWRRASSTWRWYCPACSALRMIDGLAVASSGWKRTMVERSPVSATTTLCCLSCASRLGMCVSELSDVQQGVQGLAHAVLAQAGQAAFEGGDELGRTPRCAAEDRLLAEHPCGELRIVGHQC